MKRFDIKLTDDAFADLIEIRRWVAEEADDETAYAFVDRIENKIATLHHFPERGTPRPEIRSDMRSISFERTYLIFYHVVGQTVWIDRVLSGKRDLNQLN